MTRRYPRLDKPSSPEKLAKFIATHPPAAVVNVLHDSLVVCSAWTSQVGKRFGWRIQRIPATPQAVYGWLGY